MIARLSGLLLALAIMTTSAFSDEESDPYLWLEAIEGEQPLAWVKARNAIAIDELTTDPRYEEIRAGLLEVYNSQDRIPSVSRYGEHYYNFWQDADHVRGIWRRCTPESYATAEPKWETVFDVDALAEAEGVSWVWKGAIVQDLDYTRVLLQLSDGGKDASEYREFDLTTQSFVEG